MITRSNIISIFRHFSLGEHVISRLLGHVAGRVIKKTKGGEVARIRGGGRSVDGQERVAGAVRGKGWAQSLQSLQSLPTRRGVVL